MAPLGAVLVVAMVVVSAWGWHAVPGDARFPVRFGGFGFESSFGRAVALFMWPLLGGVVLWGGAVGEEQTRWLVLPALGILLLAQVTSIRRAARS